MRLTRSVGQTREPARDHLGHRREVVGFDAGRLDPELAVVGLPRQAVLEDDHRRDGILAHGVRDVVALDAKWQRLEVQRFAQLFERLDAAQPLLLALRLVGLERVARVLVRELLQAAFLAALRDAHLDARAAALG